MTGSSAEKVTHTAQVVQHLQALGAGQGDEALASWPSSAGPVEQVFSKILGHLSGQVSSHCCAHRTGASVPGSLMPQSI